MTLAYATSESAVFVRRHIRKRSARLLEIGAGDGELASHLRALGLCVTAIDQDRRASMAARALGRAVRHACWPDFATGRVDAVLFSRALHHIAEPRQAVARAAERLAPGGVILVEEFAIEAVDARALAWLRGLAAGLAACGTWTPPRSGFFAERGRQVQLRATWAREHAGVHTSAQLRDALRAAHLPMRELRVPYLFRYLTPVNRTVQRAAARAERAAIRGGLLPAVGRRYVLGPSAR